MAIKAIINNTEKKIEQIKNSNEQDVDYVYSRIGDTEVEGESPISIKSIGGNLADYHIYGQTSRNLFDVELTNGYHLDVTTGLPVLYNDRFATLQPITINQGEYCLTYNSTTDDLSFMYSVFNNDTLIRRVTITNNRYLRSGDVIDTTGGNKIYFAFFNGTTRMISNIMLNSGSTPLPYEPYGESVGDLVTSGEHAGEYKVPVTVEGKNLWSGVVEQGAVSIIGDYEDNSKRIRSKNIPLEPGTYKLTSNLLVRMIFAYHDSTKFGKMFDVADGSENPSFTVPEGANNISVAMMKIVDNVQVDITPSDFIWGQIEKGLVATTYEPYRTPVTTHIYLPEQIRKVGSEAEYIDYGEQKQHRVRKNLLQNSASSKDANGISAVVNKDGSVTVNGTLNENVNEFFLTFASISQIGALEYGTQYIMNGSPQTEYGNKVRLQFWRQDSSGRSFTINSINGEDANISLYDTDRAWNISMIINRGMTLDGIVFKPMIRKSSITDDKYEPYIENTDLDVTLPALSTIKGTNTLSVNTSIQPSNMYIKDNFDYKRVFTATRVIEDESPLNYRSIEDSDSTLKNYRIYGQTSRNLFNETIYNKNVENNTPIYVPIYVGNVDYVTCSTTCPKTITGDNDNFNSRYIFILSGNVNTGAVNDVNGVSYGAPRTIQPSNGYVTITYRKIESNNVRPWEYQTMLNSGSTPLPYEPYGESVGDRTGNLFDESSSQYGNDLHWVPPGSLVYSDTYYGSPIMDVTGLNTITRSYTGTGANYFLTSDLSQFVNVPNAGTVDAGVTVNVPDGYTKYVFNIPNTIRPDSIMVNSGSTALPYEPYGYKVPVTVEGKNLVTSYLVEPNGGIQYHPVVFAEVNLQPNTEYLITFTVHENGVKLYSNDLLFTSVYYSSEIQGKKIMRLKTKTGIQPDQHINNKGWVLLRNAKQNPSDFTITDVKLQLVSDTPIYLPEQMRKVGDEAEYIDYAEQKMHRVRKNYLQSSDFEAGAIFTGRDWKNLTYQNSKTPPGQTDIGGVVFDTTRKRSTNLITIIGTYTISIADGWEFGIVMFHNGLNFGETFQYITEPLTISNCTFAVQLRKTDVSDISSADISDYKIMLNKGAAPLPYEPYIENTDLDVTLPELPTLAGTNTLNIETEVKPSKTTVKGHIK